ncbi:MAG: hypothetical protein MH252_06510 [Thermosynechococcaceae cyanobacterium MS004]|nr:hypothetical protein [Thermosynechococcaceae cyanobacterium MS004]
MKKQPSQSRARSTINRWVESAFGLLFVGTGIAMLLLAAPSTRPGSVVAALVVGGLGVETLMSVAYNRQSLLSRIGPLP